jgi:hypothetical protein
LTWHPTAGGPSATVKNASARSGNSAKLVGVVLLTIFLVGVAVSLTKSGGDAANKTTPTAVVLPTSVAQPLPAAPRQPQQTYVDETCLEVADKFGPSSGLSDLQMDEAWKAYRGKAFAWELSITEVSEDTFGGFSVQAKCSPRSRSFVQDIQISYPDSARALVMGLRKGHTYTLKGILKHTSSLLGLSGSGFF